MNVCLKLLGEEVAGGLPWQWELGRGHLHTFKNSLKPPRMNTKTTRQSQGMLHASFLSYVNQKVSPIRVPLQLFKFCSMEVAGTV